MSTTRYASVVLFLLSACSSPNQEPQPRKLEDIIELHDQDGADLYPEYHPTMDPRTSPAPTTDSDMVRPLTKGTYTVTIKDPGGPEKKNDHP